MAVVSSMPIHGVHSASSSFVGESRLECDSHADTSVVGRHCLVIHDLNRPVRVSGYDPSDGDKVFRMVNAVVAYDHPITGQVYMLVLNQVIEVPHLDHHLLCPMQCRLNGVLVDEIPKFLAIRPSESTHAISVPDPMLEGAYVVLSLDLCGVTSYVSVRKPSLEEWEDEERFPRLELTALEPQWDPSDPSYGEKEMRMTNFKGEVVDSAVSETNDLGRVLLNQVQVAPESRGLKPQLDHVKLSHKWGISMENARRTVRKTTQRGIRTVLHPSLSRRFPTSDRALRYRRLPHPVFADTLISGQVSAGGNKYAQVFATSFGWCRVYPMKRKEEAHEGLSLLLKRDGVPPSCIMDGSKEQVGGAFKKKLSQAGCRLMQTEPYSPWQNAAESAIRELKRGVGRKMVKTGSPKKLWDHCIELEALIRSHTALDIYMLHGEVPETVMLGETPDITQLGELSWYEWVRFRDSAQQFPDDVLVLGRYLGPSIDVGPALAAKILKSNGQIVCRSTYRELTSDELEDDVVKDAMKAFDQSILNKLGPGSKVDDFSVMEDMDTPVHQYYEDDDEVALDPLPEELEPTPEVGDNYLNAEIMLPRGGSMAKGKVVKRKRNVDGNLIGRAHPNPILDTRRYEVRFPDGELTELSANAIAESLFAQCDEDGYEYVLLDSITDHRKNDKATKKADQKINVNGRQCLRRNTHGWMMCCLWKDGSTSWVKLRDLKESHPVMVAEYAVAHGLEEEPAFNWWISHVLRKRERIVKMVRQRHARYLKRTHKWGVRLPKDALEAAKIDELEGNTLWSDAIGKEVRNVRVAFDILEEGSNPPPGYQFVKCHLVFDVKMEDLRRKARLVAGGHMTDVPSSYTYASVVSRESIRVALTLAALNDLSVKVADIMNSYVTAPVREKVWTVLGSEFGVDAGKKALIVRALYGLKSAGASFRAHLADCMQHLGYSACLADPDLWMRAAVRPDDGHQYYAYILCYVDDVMAISHDAEEVLKRIGKYFELKSGSMGDPDIYLGSKLKRMRLENGVWAWSFSSAKYVLQSIENVTNYLKVHFNSDYSIPKKAPTPFPVGYRPELDVSDLLSTELASYFQSLIGILLWIVELGRVDVQVEVSKLSSHLAMPRTGHFEAVLHVFGYLRLKFNARLVLDPTYPLIIDDEFPVYNWTQFYGEVQEPKPSNAPVPRGKEVDCRLFVDSDHAGDQSSRRSRSGLIVYLNMAPIKWISKRQATVETSVFGAEFVALKQGIEYLRGLRYKLRMMGVEVSGPSYIYGDNMSVVTNSSKPESTLKKKSNSICYHAVRESVAMGESLVTHIKGNDNVADVLTKSVVGQKRRTLVSKILYDVYDD